MTHKYIHHRHIGIILWPRTDLLAHRDMARAAGHANVTSAGFARIFQGCALCYGRSESLDINSAHEDSRRLSRQLGLPFTLHPRELSALRMSAGNEAIISSVIQEGVVKSWVGIGWIEEGKASAADLLLYPTVLE